MVAHYVYETPDPNILCQGDVLSRKPELVACIRDYFQYYAEHTAYTNFMVLTQTCDLVCRKASDRPNSPYITLAAIRPLSDIIDLEIKKKLPTWQIESNLLRRSQHESLVLFLCRLLDNNEPGFFYLHPEPATGIQEPCCCFLQLSISLREVHYEKMKAAKIAQLKEPFQAKLGWLLGNMYSRVGTTEWNDHYSNNKVEKEANGILKKRFVTVQDSQVDEGLADMGNVQGKPAAEIMNFILEKKVFPRATKFQKRALEVATGTAKLFDRIQTPAVRAMQNDQVLKDAIKLALTNAGIQAENVDAIVALLLVAFKECLKGILDDRTMPDKEAIITKFIAVIMQDPQIISIMK